MGNIYNPTESLADESYKGYFVDDTALILAYPTGEIGWFANVGTTDSIWVWDDSLGQWVNSGGGGGGSVFSVNSKTGTVVLDTDDIAQGTTNLYSDTGRLTQSVAGDGPYNISITHNKINYVVVTPTSNGDLVTTGDIAGDKMVLVNLSLNTNVVLTANSLNILPNTRNYLVSNGTSWDILISQSLYTSNLDQQVNTNSTVVFANFSGNSTGTNTGDQSLYQQNNTIYNETQTDIPYVNTHRNYVFSDELGVPASRRIDFLQADGKSWSVTFINKSSVTVGVYNYNSVLQLNLAPYTIGYVTVTNNSVVPIYYNILSNNPTLDDVTITGLSGNIITSTSVEQSIEELDDVLYAKNGTGFKAWTSGSDANTYTITGGAFQLDRAGYGYILAKKVTWVAGQQTGVLSANNTHYIYIDNIGILQSTTSISVALTGIRLYEVLFDGTNYLIAKENHLFEFVSPISGFLHNAINTIVRGTGGNIARVASGTGTIVGDRQVALSGSDIIDDHGVTSPITDTAGGAITFKVFYKNGAGKWIQYANQTEIPMFYNNAGTPTALSTTGNTARSTVYTIYAVKGDIETSESQYIAVMNHTAYDGATDTARISAAQSAITSGLVQFTDNELKSVEGVQLGYVIALANTTTGYINTIVAKSTLNQQLVGGGVAGNHSLLSNLNVDSHSQYQLTCVNQFSITDYTFTGTEFRNSGYSVSTTASNRTINIDADLFSTGFEVSICKGTNDTNTVTLDAQSGNNIDGTQTYILRNYNETVTLIKDGTNTWKIKSKYEGEVLVKTSGNQSIDGTKTFTSDVVVPAEAYGAGWNGSNEAPTKNDVYDKIESLNLGLVGTKEVDEVSIGNDKILVYKTASGKLEYEAKPTGGGTKEFRTTIPGEQIADTSNYQGMYFYNNSGATRTISDVDIAVGKAAAGTGAACAINLYKSSGTASDGINTNAVNLFTSAVDLGTNYTSSNNVPNTTTVENGRWLSLRVTSSAGATNKAQDLQVIITYS